MARWGLPYYVLAHVRACLIEIGATDLGQVRSLDAHGWICCWQLSIPCLCYGGARNKSMGDVFTMHPAAFKHAGDVFIMHP